MSDLVITKEPTSGAQALGVRLLSIPLLDMAAFPFYLPAPDPVNTGGYLPPGCKYEYSPIDLLVAGLEALRLDLKITSLVNFFDKHKNPISEHEIYLIYRAYGSVYSNSIALIKSTHNTDVLRVMHKNAPLTFAGAF